MSQKKVEKDHLVKQKCERHYKRLKYICLSENAELSYFLLCSKCLISEAQFVAQHQQNIVNLDDYLNMINLKSGVGKAPQQIKSELNQWLESTYKIRMNTEKKMEDDERVMQKDLEALYQLFQQSIDEYKSKLLPYIQDSYKVYANEATQLIKKLRSTINDIDKTKDSYASEFENIRTGDTPDFYSVHKKVKEISVQKIKKIQQYHEQSQETLTKLKDKQDNIVNYFSFCDDEIFVQSLKKTISNAMIQVFQQIEDFLIKYNNNKLEFARFKSVQDFKKNQIVFSTVANIKKASANTKNNIEIDRRQSSQQIQTRFARSYTVDRKYTGNSLASPTQVQRNTSIISALYLDEEDEEVKNEQPQDNTINGEFGQQSANESQLDSPVLKPSASKNSGDKISTSGFKNQQIPQAKQNTQQQQQQQQQQQYQQQQFESVKSPKKAQIKSNNDKSQFEQVQRTPRQRQIQIQSKDPCLYINNTTNTVDQQPYEISVIGHEKIIESDHEGSIICATLIKSNILATGSVDNSIKLWDIDKFNEQATLLCHKSSIRAIKYIQRQDGIEILVSCSEDRQIVFWDVTNISQIRLMSTLQAHQLVILGILPLQYINMVVSYSRDKTIKFWNIYDFQEELKPQQKHKQAILCADVTRNGKTLITCGQDRGLCIYNIILNQQGVAEKCEFDDFIENAHEDAVSSIVTSRYEDDLFVTSGWDNTIKIWHLSHKRILRKLNGHKDKILQLLLIEKSGEDDTKINNSEMKIINKEFCVVSLAKDKTIRLWKSNTQTECTQLTLSTLEFRKSAPYPMSQMIFIHANPDPTIPPSPRFFVCSDSSNLINCIKLV